MSEGKMDLQKFCGDADGIREWMAKPFSRGKYTYATNGHIMVRVPRRADVPEVEIKAVVENPFDSFPCTSFGPLPNYDIPKSDDEECQSCDGAGHAHSCPDCQCICATCHGSGELPAGHDVSVALGGTPIAAKYYLLMREIPGIEVGPQKSKKSDPIPFRFEGGEGRLMPLRTKRLDHIDEVSQVVAVAS